jgi:hypothetical protein
MPTGAPRQGGKKEEAAERCALDAMVEEATKALGKEVREDNPAAEEEEEEEEEVEPSEPMAGVWLLPPPPPAAPT